MSLRNVKLKIQIWFWRTVCLILGHDYRIIEHTPQDLFCRRCWKVREFIPVEFKQWVWHLYRLRKIDEETYEINVKGL